MGPQPERSRTRERVYIETTIASYVSSRPSRDLIVAGHQQITHEWWHRRRGDFELVTSEHVLTEAGGGDSDAARRRLELLRDVRVLTPTPAAELLAERLVLRAGIPPRAVLDATHIALAAAHGIEYLLTWNCRHIPNAATRSTIEAACRAQGLVAPVLCTPEELMG